MAVSRYCEYCGRAIIPKSRHAVKQYYCSPECRRAAKRSVYNENRRNARQSPEPVRQNHRLDALAMEAKIAKISYGKLMARRERS